MQAYLQSRNNINDHYQDVIVVETHCLKTLDGSDCTEPFKEPHTGQERHIPRETLTILSRTTRCGRRKDHGRLSWLADLHGAQAAPQKALATLKGDIVTSLSQVK